MRKSNRVCQLVFSNKCSAVTYIFKESVCHGKQAICSVRPFVHFSHRTLTNFNMYNTNASGKRSPSIRALIRLRTPAYLPRLTHFIWVCCQFNRRQLVCMVSWASATCVIFGDNVETTDCGYKKKATRMDLGSAGSLLSIFSVE